MSDHDDDAETGDGHESQGLERVTAPQQAYNVGQVWTGLFVLLVGLGVTFAVPLLLS